MNILDLSGIPAGLLCGFRIIGYDEKTAGFCEVGGNF